MAQNKKEPEDNGAMEVMLSESLQDWSNIICPMACESHIMLAERICTLMIQNRYFESLEKFLRYLPENPAFHLSDIILRAKVTSAFERREFEKLYKLLQENHFKNGEDLIETWDNAHYIEEELRIQKPLSALARFRVRKRNTPPPSICPTGNRKKATLPKQSTSVLKEWLLHNIEDPYPSKADKETLADQTNLTVSQVKTWFANARRRIHKKSSLKGFVRSRAKTVEKSSDSSDTSSSEWNKIISSNTGSNLQQLSHDSIHLPIGPSPRPTISYGREWISLPMQLPVPNWQPSLPMGQ